MSKKKKTTRTIPLVAMVLAWLIPGAGHVYIGRVVRGIIIFVTVTVTFWTGMALGGVMTVDPSRERWWFIAQMFSGVNGVVGWQNQRRLMDRLAKEDPDIGPPAPPGSADDLARQVRIDQRLAERGLALVSPTDNVARAYAGVAGLLNLMCIFDALMLSLMGIAGEAAPRSPPAEHKERAH